MPSLDKLAVIAETGGVSLHWLLTGKGSRSPEGLKTVDEPYIVVQLEEHLDAKVRALAAKERRSAEEQAAELVIESLISRGEVRDRLDRGLQLEFFSRYDGAFVLIPLRGEIAAGVPIHAFEEEESIEIAEGFAVKGHRMFALRVKGDSMVDERIFDGDIIICIESTTASQGDTVVALVDGDQATVKKYFRRGDKIVLRPANGEYPDLVYDPEQVRIQGIVRGTQRRV